MGILINISNTSGQSFNIKYRPSTPFSKPHWQVLELGYIFFLNGWTSTEKSFGTFMTRHLLFFSSEDTSEEDGYFMRLNDFADFWGINKGGDGILEPNFGVTFKDGLLHWELVDI